ncbi:hypothetical protein BbiDN127_D0013 (plasmid) [Borreliella bissettiae DN127]|uniref:Uncharacterized protein n=1 Tax=Borrelia bissettiae (strain DSM 17990 / CIP 109136 / DN127) TaxID=521010 RepID=G0ANY9_BORBD|nr:hypothetical protein BbiDN127_D0013 [Borreliella bissettiae DN127]
MAASKELGGGGRALVDVYRYCSARKAIIELSYISLKVKLF